MLHFEILPFMNFSSNFFLCLLCNVMFNSSTVMLYIPEVIACDDILTATQTRAKTITLLKMCWRCSMLFDDDLLL